MLSKALEAFGARRKPMHAPRAPRISRGGLKAPSKTEVGTLVSGSPVLLNSQDADPGSIRQVGELLKPPGLAQGAGVEGGQAELAGKVRASWGRMRAISPTVMVVSVCDAGSWLGRGRLSRFRLGRPRILC